MSEINEYYHFTGPQRRDKAFHTLIGILGGIAADGVVTKPECSELGDWLITNESLAAKCPAFTELCNGVRAAIADGIITSEEITDLLALADRLKSTEGYFGLLTHQLQELHGLLHGIVADGAVSGAELQSIQSWIEANEGFRMSWPVTEIETLVVSALSRGTLEEKEHAELLSFLAQFADLSVNSSVRGLILKPEEMTVRGICATDPEIIFERRGFCFTGIAQRATREECHDAVARKGGYPKNTVSKSVHYLVIHESANPCWAYSCYGRKVEEALWLRQRGEPLMIIQERDFWDALQ